MTDEKPPPEALDYFWATIEVTLSPADRPYSASEPEQRLTGYYRNFGLTAASVQQARDLLDAWVSDGAINWSDSELELIDLTRLGDDIDSRSSDRETVGIWYVSGKAFF